LVGQDSEQGRGEKGRGVVFWAQDNFPLEQNANQETLVLLHIFNNF
jgi:hypothetical protein